MILKIKINIVITYFKIKEMGCSSTNGVITKENKILNKPADMTNNLYALDKPHLQQAKSTIENIYLLRSRFLYQYHNLIFHSGACCYKNPSIVHCLKSILYKMSAEKKGFIENYELTYIEDPPYLKMNNEDEVDENTGKIFKNLLDFIVEIRSYKSLIKQLEREIPGLLYILHENTNMVNSSEEEFIKDSVDMFEELKKFRARTLNAYKNEIYYYITQNDRYVEEVNTIGKEADKNKITDIFKIAMLAKPFIEKKDIADNQSEDSSRYDMYDDVEEGKEIISKLIKEEEIELQKYKAKKLNVASLNSSSTR